MMDRRVFAALVFSLVFSSALAPTPASAAGLPITYEESYLRYGPQVPMDPGGPFTIERLIEIAREKKTIEATLDALPAGLRGRYVVIYRSRSLQQASFQSPRAVLFEDDGSFALAFNGGDPIDGPVDGPVDGKPARGHDKIEALQFRADAKRWEFREIDFSGAAPTLSQPNPRRCLECHQSARRADVDPRPNWEPYFLWPGAYGGVDGQPGRSLETEMRGRPDYASLLPLVDEQKQEAAQLAQFLAGKAERPRYRALGEFVPRRTLDMTDVFVDLNDLRVGRLAANTADWDVYGDLFGETLYCGGSRARGLPGSAPTELSLVHQALIDRRSSAQAPFVFRGSLAPLMENFFEARGIDTSDWGMDFKTGGRYAFNDRFGSPSFPEQQMRSGLLPALGFSANDAACAEAKARFDANLPRLRASGRLDQVARGLTARLESPPTDAPAAPQAMLQRCVTCHAGATPSAPPIPFDDMARLRAALPKAGYLRGTLLDEVAFRMSDFANSEEQMPPAGVPTPGERERLVEYLRAI